MTMLLRISHSVACILKSTMAATSVISIALCVMQRWVCVIPVACYITVPFWIFAEDTDTESRYLCVEDLT